MLRRRAQPSAKTSTTEGEGAQLRRGGELAKTSTTEGEGARAWGGAGRGRRGGAAEGRREKASRLLREQQQNSNKTATYGERAAGPSRGAGQGVEGEGAGVEGEGAGVEGCGCGCVVEGGAGAVEGEGVSRAGPSRGRGGCFYCGAFVALLSAVEGGSVEGGAGVGRCVARLTLAAWSSLAWLSAPMRGRCLESAWGVWGVPHTR